MLRRTVTTALALGGLIKRASAQSRAGLALSNAVFIEHPEKIGVGTYPMHGMARLVSDVELVNANWYYTWSPGTPPQGTLGWRLGEDALMRCQSTHEIELGAGADAWAILNIDVSGRHSMALSLDATLPTGSRAQVILKYLDRYGQRLALDRLDLTPGQTGHYWIGTTPAMTGGMQLTLRIISGGQVLLRNIKFVIGGEDLINREYHPAEFVPMIWGAYDVGAAAGLADAQGAQALLTFNEPDNAEQSGLSVAEAIELWPQLLATRRRLGSPAATAGETLGPQSWLGQFMAEAERRDYRVDFIAVHYYPTTPDVEKFRAFVTDIHQQYGRPIWVTEWALADWEDQTRFSAAEEAVFFSAAAQMLDKLPFVERHAWFGTYTHLGGCNLHSALISNDGVLTTVGAAFHQAAALLVS
jgi:hypothetical protein